MDSKKAYLRPFYSPYQRDDRSIIFTKSYFSSFSCFIRRLRCRMILQIVSINSSDVFTPDMYLRKHFSMTSTHFFERKRLTMTFSKKLFLSYQNHSNFQSKKIIIFIIFFPPDIIDTSNSLANDVNCFPWSSRVEFTPKKIFKKQYHHLWTSKKHI